MIEEGYTQREIAEYFGQESKEVVKGLLKREHWREALQAADVTLKSQGRPRKDSASRDIVSEQEHEIKQLKMEVALLRDFLSLAERK